MRAVVTGAAGFVGSSLVSRLLSDGHEVVGVDCLTPYYDPAMKRSNVDELEGHPRFEFVDADLAVAPIDELIDRCDVVFHQAGQPGVRSSWATGFGEHVERNILVTQMLLEAAKRVTLDRLVFASSSSVYGNAARYPTSEESPTQPYSPYGITKLGAEQLCVAYARNFNLPTVSLRYFTVYGPRQRPDMALHRLIESAITGSPFPLYGDGRQIRDFTFVDDIVDANLRAATCDIEPGVVMNVAGGGQTRLDELISLVEHTVGSAVNLDRRTSQPGDVDRTGGSADRASAILGWEPATSLNSGVEAQVAWHLTHHPARTGDM